MQRSTRYFERSNTMTREKRGLDPSENEEHQPEQKKQKVPALANVIVEALKVDSLQKLFSSLEPILRRVVSEEVERALAKLGPARLGGRSSPKRIEGPDGRNLQLHFKSQLSLPIFTGGKVEGEQGSAIHVVLLDSNTGQVVTSGPESSVKLDIVVLEGDFNKEDDDGWTEEDFESHVVKEREGKRPLLTGDLQVSLKEGVGTLGELTFTDNSSWIRSRKFRLGLKVTSGFCEGIRVREAKTDAFTVKDHRGELYKKHYPPNFNDDVWRLEKIGKDGAFHKRLNKAGIYTVEEFLRFMVKDSAKLRSILGSGMSNKMWEGAIEHAKTCILSGKLYVYYTDETRNIGVVFNNIYELNGLIMSGQYHRAERLSDSEKVFVDTLVKKAYDNWMNVIEYDGKAFLGLQQNKKMIRGEVAMCLADYPNAYDQQAPLQRLPLPIPAEQTYMGAGLTGAGGMVSSSGYNESPASRYPAHTQHVTSDTQIHYDNGVSFVPQNQVSSSSSHQTQLAIRDPVVGLALGPTQTISLGIQSMAPSAQSSNVNNPLEDWSRYRDTRAVEDIFSMDEIRARSSEMLDTEDMQHLLRFINMGGPSVHGTDDGYYPDHSYVSSPMPDYSFDEDRSRSSGKAVVGWLKLKAALRWGIFIRKIAAEKRARLVELDD